MKRPLAVSIFLCFIACALPGQQRVYFIGNSFSLYSWPFFYEDDTLAGEDKLIDSSLGGEVDASLTSGKTLHYAVQNPSSGHSGPDWDVKLSTESWDVVVMQPHTFDGFIPFLDEVAAVKTIIETARSINPNTKFYIFGSYAWMEGPDKDSGRAYRNNWTNDYPRNQWIASLVGWQGVDDTLFNTKQNFQSLFWDTIRAENPEADICWIPLGEILHQIDLDLLALDSTHPLKSVHGLEEAWDLVPDQVHLGTPSSGIDGTYVAHVAALSTIWKTHPSVFTTVYEDGIVGHKYSTTWPVINPINTDFKQFIDETVWKVVSKYLTRHYVDKDAISGTQDGSSWNNAYVNLQDALAAAAVTGGEIWVAEGTYYPDEGPGQTDGDRSATFQLLNNVGIYGGFTGTETYITERNPDPHTNGTILSGDLNQDDGGNFTNTGDNALHVVTATGVNSRAILNGFTIQGGNASGSDGGGMFCDLEASPTLYNCLFKENSADNAGGALSLDNDSDPKMLQISFENNQTTGSTSKGGAVYAGGDSKPFLHQGSFMGNSANQGGAVYTEANSGITLMLVSFHGNTATTDGGGIFSESISTNRHYEIINCEFSLNAAGGLGGSIYSNSKLTVSNGTFAGNSANQGGAIHIAGGNLSLNNSILWGNTGTTNPQVSGGLHGSSINNLIEGGTLNGSSIISNSDPRFIRSPDALTSDYGNLRLQLGSPALDLGEMDVDLDNFYSSFGPEETAIEDLPFDLSGNPRIHGFLIDLGAHELEPFFVWIDSFFPAGTSPSLLAYEQDADGDFISNFLEWAYGLIPNVSDSSQIGLSGLSLDSPGLPIVYTAPINNGVDFRAVFGRLIEYEALGLTYTVQFSADLVNWYDSTDIPSFLDSNGTIDLVSVPYPFYLITESGIIKPKFFRVVVQLAE